MPTLVPDPAQIATDDLLHKIELRTHAAYKQAAEEMAEKAQKRLTNFEKARKKTEEQLLKGEITDAEYRNWLLRQTAMNQDLKEMAEVLAKDLHKTNLIAAGIARDGMADVYAVNANYAHFDIIQQAIDTGKTPMMVGMNLQDAFWDEGLDVPFLDAGFTLYNHDTAALLLRSEWAVSPETGKNALLPKPSAKKKKELKKLANTNPDVLWNQQKLQSAILQGVLQGESMTDLARRLGGVAVMNENQAIRNARTMTTNVQNMGRQQAYQNAKDKDIKLQIVWYATLDSATRHSHRMLHGEAKPNNKTAKFSNGCRWPGDPNGPPEEVYNCRCTTVSWVEGYEQDTPHDSEWLKQQQLDFDSWQKGMNQPQAAAGPGGTPVGTQDDAFTEERKKNAKVFYDIDDAHREYLPIFQEQWEDMTEDEQFSAWLYTRNSNPINKSLSGYHDGWSRSDYIGPENTDWGHEDRWRDFGSNGLSKHLKDGHNNYKKAITDLTTAIDKCELREDAWFVRGGGDGGLAGLLSGNDGLGLGYDDIAGVLKRQDPTEMRQLKQLVEGQTFKEHSFLSTGSARGGGFTGQKVSYNIYAPKGTKAMYVEPTSYYGETTGMKDRLYKKGMKSNRSGRENETLFQRGSEYRITKLDFDEITGKIKVEMDVVRQPGYFRFGDEDTFNNGATRHKR